MKLLFSVTSSDFEIQTFCTGGNGGQHRNAKQNGVRLIHKASGARAEHRDGRDQDKNKREAFLKLLETPEWKAWHKMEVARRTGAVQRAEEETERLLDPKYLKVETLGPKGWERIEYG